MRICLTEGSRLVAGACPPLYRLVAAVRTPTAQCGIQICCRMLSQMPSSVVARAPFILSAGSRVWCCPFWEVHRRRLSDFSRVNCPRLECGCECPDRYVACNAPLRSVRLLLRLTRRGSHSSLCTFASSPPRSQAVARCALCSSQVSDLPRGLIGGPYLASPSCSKSFRCRSALELCPPPPHNKKTKKSSLTRYRHPPLRAQGSRPFFCRGPPRRITSRCIEPSI